MNGILTVRARNFGGVVCNIIGICRINCSVITANRTAPVIIAEIIICDSKSETSWF